MLTKHRFSRPRISNPLLLTYAICAHCPIIVHAATLPTKVSDTAVTVPFIGCPSDGQVGPLDAPKDGSKEVQISKEAAQRLAFYKAEQGFGVLAPRGWHCFGTYGSNGSNLYVSPTPIDATTLFSDTWKGFTGPVVQISGESGGTSGRFGVARMVARVFPSHKAFVRRVIAEVIEPASNFPSGPYPKDKLVYRTKDLVEYQTSAQTDGLGTQSRLQKNDDPIRGVAILAGPDTDLIFLATRLPSNMSDLASLIIVQVEHDVTHPEQ